MNPVYAQTQPKPVTMSDPAKTPLAAPSSVQPSPGSNQQDQNTGLAMAQKFGSAGQAGTASDGGSSMGGDPSGGNSSL